MARIDHVICGLKILAAYTGQHSDAVVANDDVIIVDVPDGAEITPNDEAVLKATGWSQRPDDQRWFHPV